MKLRRLAALILTFVLMTVGNTALASTKWLAKITSSAKVYASAKTDSKVLGTVKSGTVVTLTENKDGWAKITLDGKTGYVKSGTVKKATQTMYVKTATLVVNKNENTGSAKLFTLGFGESVKVDAVNGSRAHVTVNGKEGYCSYSSLTSVNPNTLKANFYAQKDGVKVYETPSSSAKAIASMKTNAKVTCVAQYNATWFRVKSGSKYGYVKAGEFNIVKWSKYSTASPVCAKSVEADWWKSDIRSKFYKGRTVVVTDVATGISWKVYRGGGTNHADVQPLTSKDTAAMKKACGSDFGTWNRRAIWVSIDGVKYAASMNCMPHGSGSINDNNFDGHHCIHFTNSRTHGSDSVCPKHQAAIKKALKAG